MKIGIREWGEQKGLSQQLIQTIRQNSRRRHGVPFPELLGYEWRKPLYDSAALDHWYINTGHVKKTYRKVDAHLWSAKSTNKEFNEACTAFLSAPLTKAKKKRKFGTTTCISLQAVDVHTGNVPIKTTEPIHYFGAY